MASNGNLPSSELTPITGGGQLRNDAAASWNAMARHIHDQTGTWIRVTGPDSSYRPISRQWYYWDLYRSGQGNLAAYPGSSNHGWGLAVDVPMYVRSLIDRYGQPFGWAKMWSDAPSEWWHLKYRAGVWNGSDPGDGGGSSKPDYPVLKKGKKGKAVKRAQKHLRRWNVGITQPATDGTFGDKTKTAVREFQIVHDLHADGVIGAKTWKQLRQKDHFLDDERSHINRIRLITHGKVSDKNRDKVRALREWCDRRAHGIAQTAKKHGWSGQYRRQRHAVLKKLSTS